MFFRPLSFFDFFLLYSVFKESCFSHGCALCRCRRGRGVPLLLFLSLLLLLLLGEQDPLVVNAVDVHADHQRAVLAAVVSWKMDFKINLTYLSQKIINLSLPLVVILMFAPGIPRVLVLRSEECCFLGEEAGEERTSST